MSTKVLKYISVCVLVLAFGVFGTAQAAVTVGTTSVTSNGALTLTGATASTWTTTAGALTLTSAAAATWSTSAGALTLTGTGGLTLDSGTTTAVNLGTAAAAKTITIGNAASTLLDLDAISIDIDGAGTGVTIDALDAGTLNIGTSAVAASDTSAINIGTSATARTITVGAAESTIVDINAISVDIDGAATGVTIDALDAGSINLGTSADAASDTSAVNVGTSATARTITVGNAASTEAEINALLIDINGGATGITVDSAGAISLDAAAASNFTTTGAGIDITIDATAGSVVVDSGEAAADALLLQATGGTTATAHLTSNGTGASAIDIDATGVGGGIDIDAGTGGINVATTSTTANAINVIASGIVAGTALNLDTTDGGIELDANGADNGDIIINAADVLDIDSADALSINSSAGVINIGNDAVSQNISIGTAGTRTIAIGSATTKINATAADDSLVNLSAATNTTTAVVNKGLIIPISADCALGITEGQICWDSDNNVLYVGDAAAAVAVAGSTGAANTWTDNQIYTLLGDEDIAITSDLGADLTATKGVVSIKTTPSAVAGTQNALYISQENSANAQLLDVGIRIENLDLDAALADGILFVSAAGAITDAIDASDTDIVNAINVGTNVIAITTGTIGSNDASIIDFVDFDVSADGLIVTLPDAAGDSFTTTLTAGASQALVVTATAAMTETAGIIDLDINAGDAAVDGINISLTQNDLASAAVDATALEILLTANDADGDMFGITITSALTANAAAGSYEAGILIENLENIAATMTSGILVRATTDTAITTALDVSDGEIVNALSIGANNIVSTGTVTFNRVDAGTVTLTATDDNADAALTISSGGTGTLTLDGGGASAIVVGSADVTSLTAIVDNDVTIQNGATGNVTLDFRDYADTTDDDMAHAILTVNCTATGTGAENCDFTIGVVEAGAAAQTRFNIDADGGITLGSANTNSLTVTTDGTGDGEVVLPGLSVGESELTASSGTGLGVLRTARAKYDFASDGGLVSTITPALTAALPDNAVIVGGTINSTTAATSGGSATIAVGISAGGSTTSFLGATAVASFSLDALINSTATFAIPVKLTAAGSITVTIATAALTAGVIEVTVFYYVAAN